MFVSFMEYIPGEVWRMDQPKRKKKVPTTYKEKIQLSEQYLEHLIYLWGLYVFAVMLANRCYAKKQAKGKVSKIEIERMRQICDMRKRDRDEEGLTFSVC